MVKHLRHFWTVIKRLVLISTIALMALGFWLHGGERSLAFAKPWIERAVNSADAPYVIAIGGVSIDWSNVAMLGKLRIAQVTFAKRDGSIFAQMPALYATIDPIGFLPGRRLLHNVILHKPRLYATRNAEHLIELGFNDAPSRMPLSDLTTFFIMSDNVQSSVKAPSLPFKNLMIEDAVFTFTDENSGTIITSNAFDFDIQRRHGAYEALMTMPFTVDEQPVTFSAALRAHPRSDEHVLIMQLSQVPSKLICLFDACPDKVTLDGALSGTVAVNVADDFSFNAFNAALSTPKALFTAPQWFAEPLKLKQSNVTVAGDVSKRVVVLSQSKLQLEDTTIMATANLHKGDDGWYATANAETTRLDVDKIYKYWPLIMAPDSRTWITAKLKSGYAAKGTLKLNLTPADLAADTLPEKAVDAVADARDITFEYLPGFPLVEKMNGIAHFTGTTVKVEGASGSLMSGTTIRRAVLWCPDLNSVHNPMEAEVTLSAPAADAATMLALKHFPFDDAFGLNPKTIRGTVDASMKLKFNAFSGNENSDPNEIHLEAVDYDIAATLKDVAQESLYGGYHAKSINGALKATNAGLTFDGKVALGDAGTNSVLLSQPSGKALNLKVNGVASADGKPAVSHNDFSLTYLSGLVPTISLRGNTLDASVVYGGKDNSLLANFPAMKLDIKLGELLLVRDAPFKDVTATMHCTAARCESAEFSARSEKDAIAASIRNVAGARQFVMTTQDAGSMLKAFDITDRMSKGVFEMRGAYDESASPPQLNARLIIKDFTLKNSQILGRIFSIGSLTGLSNALTGSGIAFEKLSANITSRGGLITVDKGIAQGTALGITVEGTVDTNASMLGLKGALAPAYAINSMLGKIPVIGFLAGGEGEGLIAFNYWVKGPYANPDVGVNPLSGLTPGFLRGIFGVFEESHKKQVDKKLKGGKAKGLAVENPTSAVHKR